SYFLARATENCDWQNSKIHFESATHCDRSAVGRFVFRACSHSHLSRCSPATAGRRRNSQPSTLNCSLPVNVKCLGRGAALRPLDATPVVFPRRRCFPLDPGVFPLSEWNDMVLSQRPLCNHDHGRSQGAVPKRGLDRDWKGKRWHRLSRLISETKLRTDAGDWESKVGASVYDRRVHQQYIRRDV